MTMSCQACNHPKLKQLNKELVRGRSKASLAREYGISENSLLNHQKNHLSRQLLAGAELALKNDGLDVMNELTDLMDRTKSILDQAEGSGHKRLALSAIQQIRGNLTLVCQIENEIYKNRLLEQESGQGIQDPQEEPDLSVLSKEESNVYFLLCQKILQGDEHTTIPGIIYHNAPSDGEIIEVSAVNDETKQGKPSVLDRIRERRSESKGTMKRTRFSEEDEAEAPTGIGPIQPKELSSESKNMSYRERKQYYGG